MNINIITSVYKELDKIKGDLELSELLKEISTIYNGIISGNFTETNFYVEQVVAKHKMNGDFDGIINVRNEKPVKFKTQENINAITEEENCRNVLDALLKLAMKKIINKQSDEYADANYGDNVEIIFKLFKKVLNID